MLRSSTDVYFGLGWATRCVLDLRDWFSALRFVPSSTTHHGESMAREDAYARGCRQRARARAANLCRQSDGGQTPSEGLTGTEVANAKRGRGPPDAVGHVLVRGSARIGTCDSGLPAGCRSRNHRRRPRFQYLLVLNESHRERVPGWRQLAHRSTPPPSLEVQTIQSSRLGHEEVVHLIWLCMRNVDRVFSLFSRTRTR